MSLGNLLRHAVETVREPRAGARWAMSLDLKRRERWEIMALIAVVSAAMSQISVLLGDGNIFVGGLELSNGFEVVVVLGTQLLGTALAMAIVGRWFGGTGTLDDAIVLVCWLQFILLTLQAAQIVVAVVFPPLALFLGIVGMVLLFWLLVHFVAEMHGFQSLGLVFVAIVASMVALAVPFAIVLRILGFDVSGGQ